MIGRISKVRKRDGRLVDFDESKIADAIHKASCAVSNADRFLSEELAGVVTLFLEKRYSGTVPGIEEIQDMVERVLIETGHARMAKAYILYRERRARARELVAVESETAGGPIVGNPAKALVSPWQKARVAEALVREADLDKRVAAEVATRVEEKVLSCNVRRITTTAIRSLVEAELFLMGYGDRIGRQALVGLPRYDIDELLRGGKRLAWRPNGPRQLKRAIAEALLAQYALSEVYSAEVVDAHLDRRIHITDVGAPFEWLAASAPMPAAGDVVDWVETGVALAHRLGGVVTRDVTLTNVVGGAWCAEPGSALSAARRLLGHPALPRGGPQGVALALSAVDDTGLAEAMVREHWARFRSGALDGLPSLILHVPADLVAQDAGRKALLPALAAGAETGRIHIALDHASDDSANPGPALVTPWYRVPPTAAETGATGAALGVSGAVALDVSRLDGESEEELIESLDMAIALGLKALRQKRSFMESLQADPAGPLYRVAAGARPLIADTGLELVHLVGLMSLADRMRQPRLAGRLRSYAAVRLAEEGRSMRLRAILAPESDGAAAQRFSGGEPYTDREGYSVPGDPALEAWHDPVASRLILRFPRESAPAPEALYEALALLVADTRVEVVHLLPWPDRSVHASRKVAADL